MTLREKVGQLFIVVPESLDFSLSQHDIDYERTESSTVFTETMHRNLERYPVGGIILFGKNIETPDQTGRLIGDFMKSSRIPLFVAVDEEGGRVARIARNEVFGVKNFAPAFETESREKAYFRASETGAYLKMFGFNLNFAPVADVWTNGQNKVIGDRAFSTDPSVAAEMVASSVEGFHAAKIFCAVKHFPGHGDTWADSHSGSAFSEKSWTEMKKCEMLPFEAGIRAGTDMVMIAHITTPNATKKKVPATLSREWVTDRLRKKLKFDGVVVTDAMNMKAVTSLYPSGKAAFMAIDAGCDIILMPEDFQRTFEYMVQAVESGRISEDRINESVSRILRLKDGMK